MEAETPKSITDILIPDLAEDQHADLEQWRLDYERTYGPTPLACYYVTRWPEEQRKWLLHHHPKHYWQALPPFVQDYVRASFESAIAEGALDDMSDEWLRAYTQGAIPVEKLPPEPGMT